MRDYLLKKWIQIRHCEDGVTLVEYGIAVALAVAVGTVALTNLASDISGAMSSAGAKMP